MISRPQVQKLSGEQIRAARGLLRWEQRDLAEASKLSVQTIKRLEAIHGEISAQAATTEALCITFAAAGIEFIEGGVRLRQD